MHILVSPKYDFKIFCERMLQKNSADVLDATLAESKNARLHHRETTKDRDFRKGSRGRAYCDDLGNLIRCLATGGSNKVSEKFLDAVYPLALHLLHERENVGLRRILDARRTRGTFMEREI
jgi:hypothetical protein